MKFRKILTVIITVWLIITLAGGLYLRAALPTRSNKKLPPTGDNTVRVAIFADSHITNAKEETQTDIGAPSSEITKNAKYALQKINPDVIFGLGDLTAHTENDEWVGYNKWIEWTENAGINVYDLLGNHDRDHHIGVGNYGTGYFTEVGRVSGTKILKMGNNVFILISEEHNPEGDNNSLSSTIPEKRFEFVKKYLKRYSGSNNIFVANHVQMSGTAAYTKTWYLGSNKNWEHITKKLIELLDNYGADAHLSGHIHTDYRWKDTPLDQDLWLGVENVGKFVSGTKINKHSSERKYPPKNLPNNYFLNMPVVDFAHGWFGSRLALFHKLWTSMNPPETSNEDKKTWIDYETLGPAITDFLYSPKSSYFLGRGAVYYFNMENGENTVNIITRWIGGNRDVENYPMELSNPINIGNGKMQFIASDLSLRKKDGLIITRDNWFKIKSGQKGRGEFSIKYKENKLITGLSIENYNLKTYSAKWKGSTDHGDTWEENWHENAEDMNEVNAVLVKIDFEAPNEKTAYVEDIDPIS